MNTTTVGSELYADTNFSRAEDLKLILGQGHFTADQSYPGELHLFVIRSQYPHARITRMAKKDRRSVPNMILRLLDSHPLLKGGEKAEKLDLNGHKAVAST